MTFTRLRRLSLSHTALIGLVMLVAAPVAVEAQAVVRFGRGSASIVLPVRLTIPARLSVTTAGPERVVERTPEFTEVVVPVVVAANLSWTLRASLPAERTAEPVRVLAEDGVWRVLGVPGIAVRAGEEPIEPTEVLVRLRIPAGAQSAASLGLRFSLAPTIGAP